MAQAQIDGGRRQGATGEELAEIKELKAKVRRLEEDDEILRRASILFAGELDPRLPRPGPARSAGVVHSGPSGAWERGLTCVNRSDPGTSG